MRVKARLRRSRHATKPGEGTLEVVVFEVVAAEVIITLVTLVGAPLVIVVAIIKIRAVKVVAVIGAVEIVIKTIVSVEVRSLDWVLWGLYPPHKTWTHHCYSYPSAGWAGILYVLTIRSIRR